MPPLAANAFNTSSDLFRKAGCQEAALAWVIAIGLVEYSIASSVERSAE